MFRPVDYLTLPQVIASEMVCYGGRFGHIPGGNEITPEVLQR